MTERRWHVHAIVHPADVENVEGALERRGYHWSSEITWIDGFECRRFVVSSQDNVGTIDDRLHAARVARLINRAADAWPTFVIYQEIER